MKPEILRLKCLLDGGAYAGTNVVVIPERRHILSKRASRKVPRTDIWIEIHAPKEKALIVLENKIGSRESSQQLEDYEYCAGDDKKWRRRLFIFLTIDGEEAKSASDETWVPVSYAHLARVLRDVARNLKRPFGAWILLYVASIVRNVLGLRIDRKELINIPRLQQYLEG